MKAMISLKRKFYGSMIVASALLFAASAFATLNCNLPQCKERVILSEDGVTHIVARDWGNKHQNRPTLLLLHGYPHDQDAWVSQIQGDLRNKYRIITMDLRGMGQSDKPTDPNSYVSHLLAGDVDSVVNAFGVQKMVIVNHSYGAAPTIAYLIIKGTDKVAGLVSVAPAHSGISGINLTPDAFTLIVSQFPPVTPEAFFQSNIDFITMSFSPQNATNKDYKDLLSQDLLVAPDVRVAILTAPQEAPPAFVEAFMSGLVTVHGIKTLFVYGQQDAVVEPSSVVYLNNLVVGSQLIGYPNQGHLLQLSNTNQFNKDLKRFLESVDF